MAHIKTGGTTKGNRDSISKRLGVKIYGGSNAISGNIIVRQRGTKFHPGEGVRLARDFSIYAVQSGVVHFKKHLDKTIIEVLPASPAGGPASN